MLWIGITGVMGSGKTTVSRRIEELGYPVEYADQVARAVVAPGSPGIEQVEQAFGADVLNGDGSLNREALGKLVFGDAEKLRDLEGILHPLIHQRVTEFRATAESQGAEFAFYDIPLLFEKKLMSRFDVIVCVIAEREELFNRLRAREGWDREEVESRLRHQVSQDEKMKGSQYILDNSDDMEALFEQIESMIDSLTTSPILNT